MLTLAAELIAFDTTNLPFDVDDPQAAVARLGQLARLIGASLRDTADVTMLRGGQAPNAVPTLAEATVDGRMLPGREEAFTRELMAVLGPDVETEWDTLAPVSSAFDTALVDAMAGAVDAEDPGASVLPYLMPASTDAKAFAGIGIRHYGFTPRRLPPDLDFAALFHGVDERVPVDALEFGCRVLDRFLRTC